MNVTQSQVMNIGSEFELNDVRKSVQLLLRWAWKYDKNLEEQAAELHMLTAWSQLAEVKDKIAREIMNFVRGHEVLFDQVLRQDIYANNALLMEQINLVVGVLSKGQRNSDLNSFRLCFGLVSYLYSLVTKKSVRLQVSQNLDDGRYIAVLETCQAAAKKEKLLTLLLPLAEQILNIILIHSQDGSILPDAKMSSRAIAYGTERGVGQDVNHFCGELIQVLVQLELLSEDKASHNLKVFHSSIVPNLDLFSFTAANSRIFSAGNNAKRMLVWILATIELCESRYINNAMVIYECT
ncbi:hypothetical protein MLD38_014827 [Melastoma candidum]|uniref:Uncharacterized protein n=1 Tax=Melastoma candidum TaxID=119954 RepID=A0ACB9RDB3_9MYRT|nr:hypothetical protein MLD38_014827 [Melastoma candidum]